MPHFLAIMFALLTTIVGMTNIAAADQDVPTFKITTKRDSDKVKVTATKKNTILSVHSPIGISQAVVERGDPSWPDVVTVRLHLKGLEHLRITNGKTTLVVAVSSHGEHLPIRLWLDGHEDSPLTAKNPFWMEVRIGGHDVDTVNSIPLANKYFEMRLPKALFEGNPKSITINWIDFYR